MDYQPDFSQYTETTNDICVSVWPLFVNEQSDIDKSLFAFAYFVKIENCGDTSAQLINRHWRVFSGTRQIADVKGSGVIGEQPVLAPGAIHEYNSWTIIHDPAGWMVGSYTLRREGGEFFDVVVPRFDLIHAESISIH